MMILLQSYMGLFTRYFLKINQPLLVRLHNEGKDWSIVAIEAMEED